MNFGYNIGAGIKLGIGRKAWFHINASYAGSTLSFPGYVFTLAGPGGSLTYPGNYPFTMSLGMIEISAGLSSEL